ncbi:hypothetical protein C485_01365 [Natrinema altunense JCM 12890]|uniref:Uncharacterized protein n=1 Tax=Natrinema altunense (strain JCM 12890 / CGMCC 1.3731 / AJ2) TaxID=1227494 RepID=L9ZYQ9_NATA2|nr:hypothetical protein C485_01365 [Natrinema altunense JCM 12890]
MPVSRDAFEGRFAVTMSSAECDLDSRTLDELIEVVVLDEASVRERLDDRNPIVDSYSSDFVAIVVSLGI